MTEIIQAAIGDIDPNPFRMLADYPYVERKLDSLQRSYADVGMWEGVIARPSGNRYQIAFGHHRVEAARRSGMATAPLLIRKLDDTEMLQFMGRENLEDYNSNFLTMLETWDAAVAFAPDFVPPDASKDYPIVIARLLGWTSKRPDGHDMMTPTARACQAAYNLIKAGHLTRADLADLSVKAARELTERAQANLDMVEKSKRPVAEQKQMSRHIAGAAKTVARDIRDGKVATKDIRGQVDAETWAGARAAKQEAPLFAVFGSRVAESIHRMLRHDDTAERLDQIVKALPQVTMEEDRAIVREIDFRLAEHETRTNQWRKELAPQNATIIPFKALEGGKK